MINPIPKISTRHRWLHQQKHRFWLLFLLGFYAFTALPNLANYPVVEMAQMGIAAPAYQLAQTGVYGNDLYRGFYRTDEHNYEYLPLYPLLVTAVYAVFGLSVTTARLVSVFSGGVGLWLTYELGKKLISPSVGLWAVAILTLFPLAVAHQGAGDMYPGAVPWLDFARVIRYDILVPVWVLAASLAFLTALERGSLLLFFMAGVLAGLGTLTHIYGAFILVVLGLLLLWQNGRYTFIRPPLYLFALGWGVTLVPWLLYIAQDWPAYVGQNLRHQSRFELWQIHFYVHNLLQEPWRYVKLVGRFRPPLLWPRPAFWLTLMAVVTAHATLLRHRTQPTHRFLLLALPTLFMLLALLVSFKRYTYFVLLLPFVGLTAGFGITLLWAQASHKGRGWQILFALWVGLSLLESGLRWRDYRQAVPTITPYAQITAGIRAAVRPGDKVLMMHDYWLGLADADVYSLDLLFVLSDPAYGWANTPSPMAVLQEIDPDIVVINQHILKLYRNDPQNIPHPQESMALQELDAFLQAHCQVVHDGGEDADYGRVLVFRCH